MARMSNIDIVLIYKDQMNLKGKQFYQGLSPVNQEQGIDKFRNGYEVFSIFDTKIDDKKSQKLK